MLVLEWSKKVVAKFHFSLLFCGDIFLGKVKWYGGIFGDLFISSHLFCGENFEVKWNGTVKFLVAKDIISLFFACINTVAKVKILVVNTVAKVKFFVVGPISHRIYYTHGIQTRVKILCESHWLVKIPSKYFSTDIPYKSLCSRNANAIRIDRDTYLSTDVLPSPAREFQNHETQAVLVVVLVG